MHLVEILLPVADNEWQRFDARKYEEVRQDLSLRFGGITTFTAHPPTALVKPRARSSMTISSYSK